MEILDVRRLTGLNLDIDGAGVVAEVDFGDPAARVAGFAAFVRHLRIFMGDAAPVMRPWADGGKATIAFSAPIDRLYACVNLVEGVLKRAADAGATDDWAADPVAVAEVKALFEAEVAAEVRPELLLLQSRAEQHGVPFLWDDDEVSVGFGASTRVWPATELPSKETIEALDWHEFSDMPKVFITGTNGKTTTSRMVSRILKTAGLVVGATSTDALTVDEVIIDKGDWTGPGAARRILRHPLVAAAVLETARGGMLRRGLGVTGVDAAAVTNVGADHFGDHGIVDLAGMAATKATVWKAVRPGGKRIVNAECAASFAAALALGPVVDGHLDPSAWVLFALDGSGARITQHRASGGEAWSCNDGCLVHHVGTASEKVERIDAIPATWGGLARHNLANALTAAALAFAVGIDHATIATGLRSFGASPDDNPGRAECWKVGGATIVLDFGHNAHGIEALAPLIHGLRAGRGRLTVSVGQAGDRSNDDLDALVHAVLALRPDRVLVRSLPGYERGRAEGEVEQLLVASFRRHGGESIEIAMVSSEVAALELFLADAKDGDFSLHLVHIERAPMREALFARGASARF